MRISMLALAFLLAAAFIVGRTTSPTGARASSAVGHTYTGAVGDLFRAPAAAMQCAVGTDTPTRSTAAVCARTPTKGDRYFVVFTKTNLVVRDLRYHNRIVFSTRGRR
jgi:hypothetical protein